MTMIESISALKRYIYATFVFIFQLLLIFTKLIAKLTLFSANYTKSVLFLHIIEAIQFTLEFKLQATNWCRQKRISPYLIRRDLNGKEK